MKFTVGQKVKFSSLGTKKIENAEIIERGIDYPKGFIYTTNEKGKSDYLISVVRNDIIEHIFCMEYELK